MIGHRDVADGDLDATVREAWAAHERLDWDAAIRHWRACIRLHPGLAPAYWMAGALLLDKGNLDEAEAMLDTAVGLDPDNISLAVKHAQAATARQDWAEAARRWDALLRRAPDNREVIDGHADAVMQSRMQAIDQATGAADPSVELAAPSASVDAALFMRFESLGDNCEFGLVQRHFGAEPLSLLRWNSIGIEVLIAGIEAGFVDVGDPERTELVVRQHDEYVLLDRRYGMAMHTFLKAAQVPPAARAGLHGTMCRRQAYLGRMLIEGLREATKVYVVRANHGASPDSVRRLHAAMLRYGPNRLLHVVQADATRCAGSLEQVAPSLFVGAIDRLCRDERWDQLSFGGWRDLCRKVPAHIEPPGASAASYSDSLEPLHAVRI